MSIYAACPKRGSQCGRKYRQRGDWNAVMSRGVMVGILCPPCQSQEENAEAAINDATLDYSVDSLGRITGKPTAT